MSTESRDVAGPDPGEFVSAAIEHGRERSPSSSESHESDNAQSSETPAPPSREGEAQVEGPKDAAPNPRPSIARLRVSEIVGAARQNTKGLQRQVNILRTAKEEAEQNKKEIISLRQQLEDANNKLAEQTKKEIISLEQLEEANNKLAEQSYMLKDAMEDCKKLRRRLDDSIYITFHGESEVDLNFRLPDEAYED